MKTKAEAMKDLARVFRSQITLLKPVKLPDGMGGHKTDWPTVDTVWGDFRKEKRELVIWFRSDIQNGWRVSCEGQTFDIETYYDIARERMVLILKETGTIPR